MENTTTMPTGRPGEYIQTAPGGMIYQLIGKAIGKIGAIGKDKKNAQQGFMYRGIDQVYNALNPVMAELGIFFCPEVLDQKREERVTRTGSVLTYTILTMRYTAYAPDGSSVSMTVVGEGMDSGDKGCNKAMSVAMKYAMFQLFCIPTEEMRDTDADVYKDVLPSGTRQPAPQASTTDRVPPAQPTAQAVLPDRSANPTTPPAPKKEMSEGAAYLAAEKKKLEQEIGGSFNFGKARLQLIADGKVESIPSATITLPQAQALIKIMRETYGKQAG